MIVNERLTREVNGPVQRVLRRESHLMMKSKILRKPREVLGLRETDILVGGGCGKSKGPGRLHELATWSGSVRP